MKILRRTLSRRSFLKLGTAGAAAAAFPQIVPSGTLFGAATPSGRLNVALIGLDGKRVWESGHLDSAGDMLDLHSLDVRAGRAKRDLDRLLRASSSWDQPGR